MTTPQSPFPVDLLRSSRSSRRLTGPSLRIPDFTWSDLIDARTYPRLTRCFDDFARGRLAPRHWLAFERYRASEGTGMSPEEVSDVIIAVAPVVADFIAMLFGTQDDRTRMRADLARESVVFVFKREFIKKRTARRKRSDTEALSVAQRAALDASARALLSAVSSLPDQWNDEREVASVVVPLVHAEELFRKSMAQGGVVPTDTDRATARTLAQLLRAHAAARVAIGPVLGDTDPETDSDAAALYAAVLDAIDRWCHLRMVDEHYDHHWVSLRQPHTIDPDHLVQLQRPRRDLPEALAGEPSKIRDRDGFALTDRRKSPREVQSEVDYCIYCHDRAKDSCSKGLRGRDGAIKPNALGIPLNGCPLDEKISEAHTLRRDGDTLAALAVVMVDNPMCPGTGHRICNDCMKACIYQKQDPVNIPEVETAVLSDVLSSRWGFEIYALLTRWNPLRARRPYALPYNGKNVMVVGMGPAGYTLAHYLLNEGFGVVGVDGLKVEPLPSQWLDHPVEHYETLACELDERIALGFGGVSEYGITVRWDKNFLSVIYLALSRRERFAVYGGVRFGGTVDLADCWKLGFHHVAIAAGAGRPTLIDIPNGLLRGIRQASDFLMALQLTGAYRKSSLANLPVRLPAVVIGGGLTAIDTATELRAYYPVQVEKLLERHETLTREVGDEAIARMFTQDEREVLDEALAHGRAVRAARAAARRESRPPRFNHLLDAWGGVSIAYRRSLHDSPAYRLNHEEVEKCLEEGVVFIERLAPREALADPYGAVRAMVFDRMSLRDGSLVATGETVELPARTVCIAAGTSPNVTYAREAPGAFQMDPATRAFRRFRADRAPADGALTLTEDPRGFFTSYVGPDGELVSFYGDNHPYYAGSVVRAMSSARDGHLAVARHFAHALRTLSPDEQPARDAAWDDFRANVADQLTATVHAVHRLTPSIVEVVVRAPLAARKFQPGQFYRLQNFEAHSPMVEGTRLAMEGLALTGAWTDPDHGLLSMIVLEMGASSRLCATLRPGDPVVVMGPTGAPTEIPKDESVLLCGGGLGNAVLFSIGKALRANGCRVLYFAGYKNPGDVFRVDDIEASADVLVWASDVGPAIQPRRPQDHTYVGNIVGAMDAYARGVLGPTGIPMGDCHRIIAIGSDRMMAAVRSARHGVLRTVLSPRHVAIGSINSPMQCMLKEICAQCLQRHVDPVTGKASVVFTCFNQDQELDRVDFDFLRDRLRQGSMQEKLSNVWLERLLKITDTPRV